MTRGIPQQIAFVSGELTSKLSARYDISWTAYGCRTLLNMLPLSWGPATRRPGTEFYVEAIDSNVKGKLMPFEKSIEEVYCLQFGERSLRFITVAGQVVVLPTTAAITNGTFDSDITGWTDASTGAATISHTVIGGNGALSLDGAAGEEAIAEQEVATAETAQTHVLCFEVLGAISDSIDMRIGATSGADDVQERASYARGHHTVEFTPGQASVFLQFINANAKSVPIDNVALLGSGASAAVPLELVTPYPASVLFSIRRTQSADVLYLAMNGIPTQKLLRSEPMSFSIVDINFQDGPWEAENADDSKTLQPSAASGFGVTITAAGHAPFKADMLDRLVRLNHTNEWGYAVITGFVSSTQVIVDVLKDFNGTAAVPAWQLGLYYEANGYPAACELFEERFCTGGAPVAPDRIDTSQTGDFENFTPGVEDDEGISRTLAARQVNAIVNMIDTGVKPMMVLTRGSSARLGPIDVESAITPTDAPFKIANDQRSADVQAIPIGNAVIFVQRAGRKILELVFSFEQDAFRAPDLTRRAEHLTVGKILDMCYEPEPFSIVWMARGDGYLLSMTYVREEGVIAFAAHCLGGSYNGGNAVVESCATVPGDKQDRTFLLVKRTINGETKRYIELLDEEFTADRPDADAFHVDCGLRYKGAPTKVFTGLDHLEGETVEIYGDGARLNDQVVSGGQITIDENEVSQAAIGLGYAARLNPITPRLQLEEGFSHGMNKNIAELVIEVERSGAFLIGRDLERLDPVPLRTVVDAMDTAVPLFTGFLTQSFDGDVERDPDVFIVANGPMPLTVQSLSYVMSGTGQ